MEDWALRAMQRWPNVPALFGWLGLDRRGRWLIQGEIITRPQIIDTINRNYAADSHGRWFFQNGPQRGYIALEYAPFVLGADGPRLKTHTDLAVERASHGYIDEEGSLVLQTEHGAGLLRDSDLEWALDRMASSGTPVDEAILATVLSLPCGPEPVLTLTLDGAQVALMRADRDTIPAQAGFVRVPQPREGEAVSGKMAD